ncbi:MAG: type 2 lanthipeptide synthetase LanM family protein [Ktedonobacteraceae bacterium]
MEKILTEISHQPSTIWQKPDWYQAATPHERIASLAGAAPVQPARDEEKFAKAARKLQLWKEQAPFNDGSYFKDRLAIDAITENDLLALLAEPIEAVQARLSSPALPGWLRELILAYEEYGDDQAALPLMQEVDQQRSMPPFLYTVQPLLASGLKRFLKGIDALCQEYPHPPFDRRTIASLCFANISQVVLPKLGKTLVLELNVARLRGQLRGATAEERFDAFVQRLSQKDGMLPILAEYPVLARQLVNGIDQWVNYNLEFLRHLCADWADICTLLAHDSAADVLAKVTAGEGDTHRGGRSVITLKFLSGLKLVYKPKSLAIDVHFQELLAWINAHGAHPPFRTLKVLDRGNYGWTEFVEAAACTSQAEVERFYERQGGYLALLYMCEAADFHNENVIAAGEHPMLIDLEALLHPRAGNDNVPASLHPAHTAFAHSVLRTGMLPQRRWASDEVAGIDISGLGGQQGQLTPRAIPKWEGIGTDEMRLIRARAEIPVRNNRPSLNNQDVDTLQYSESIITGFSDIYRLLLAHRDELVTEILPRFAQDEIRFVPRPTRTYTLLLHESFHPNMLRSALRRDRLLDRLWLDVAKEAYLARLISAERSDLVNGDIPMFTTCPASQHLYTSQGEQIENFFAEASLKVVLDHVRQLSEDDLATQAWIIRASFTSMTMGTNQSFKQALELKPTSSKTTNEDLQLAARNVGERLASMALRSGDAVGWLGLVMRNEREWELVPADAGLYSGTPGIALFLGYLGFITGADHYTTLCKAALKTLEYEIEQHKNDAQITGIGAFNGLGSLIYLFSHLGAIWNEPALFAKAEELVDEVCASIASDERLDIIGGSAGCIASLLSLYAVKPSARTLAAAIQCGDHLLTSAQPMREGIGWRAIEQEIPLAGFSHGVTGIALSLLRLAAASGEDRFRQSACAALTYERSLFVPEQCNWLDLRGAAIEYVLSMDIQSLSRQNAKTMVAWCHGAAGIGLGRLASLSYIDDAKMREEIAVALQTTIAEGFGHNHSLCHGDLGNLETLLVATQVLENGSIYREPLESLTAMLLASIHTHGWVTAVPTGFETPGLMTGLAGIGYELLRLSAPGQVPSVLLLAPPTPHG